MTSPIQWPAGPVEWIGWAIGGHVDGTGVPVAATESVETPDAQIEAGWLLD